MENNSFVFDHVHLISADPNAAAQWYVNMFDARIAAKHNTRGAAQINVQAGGMTILIRGRREAEAPATRRAMKDYGTYSSHDEWGTDHFGFTYQGDLFSLCEELREKGAEFSVEPWEFAPAVWLCYLKAPDGVSIEIVQSRQK